MLANKRRSTGIVAALSSALFLGLAPVFGRWAILNGFSPLAVVTLRTGMAAAMLLAIIAIFRPQYLYIFPVGLVGCMLAGAINGLGSLLYYMALGDLPEGPTSPDLEVPTWIAYSCVPLGSALMCFRFLQVAWHFWRTGEAPHAGHGVAGVESEEAAA